jgi:hypothetical protein
VPVKAVERVVLKHGVYPLPVVLFVASGTIITAIVRVCGRRGTQAVGLRPSARLQVHDVRKLENKPKVSTAGSLSKTRCEGPLQRAGMQRR